MFHTPLTAPLFAFAPHEWLDDLIRSCTALAPDYTFFAYPFNIRALLALILVSLCCGAIGSLVVGGRKGGSGTSVDSGRFLTRSLLSL